jgi:hypothetical protein
LPLPNGAISVIPVVGTYGVLMLVATEYVEPTPNDATAKRSEASGCPSAFRVAAAPAVGM